ncbi:muscular LMNA-interacting protein isoform X2 [Pimephales promelas]|uniref:muscular LMNA-interacting protein isoform X2 n=1 Tax=Pimephales promelas TaxID=90988 RepID=UPI0019558703|nr:muscular LMNA-interacting protein isoform X2 [Pimephales promelas]
MHSLTLSYRQDAQKLEIAICNFGTAATSDLVSLSNISVSNVRLPESQGTLRRAWRRRVSTRLRLFTSKRTTLKIQSTDTLTLNPPSTLVGSPAELGSITPAMETSVNKHHLGFHNSAEVSSGLCLNSSSRRDEVLSPAGSLDFLTSSKESILSEGWDKDRSWFSRHGSPGPFSGTVSPCSSVRSGTFTPSVVRIKRLSLAPGSSLLEMSSVCGTPCDSRTTSPCPLSPRARHRTPPTQLSLLTAILRKGRLPVLSSSSQRPYTPCWPISPVNMSSCLACSAASSVAPMNVSKAKSCTSIDTKSFQISKPQIWKRELVEAPDESPLIKPPERPTNHISSPSLPAVQSNAHLSKSSPKGIRLPTVPSALLCGSDSGMRSPTPRYLSSSRNENHKNPPVSAECLVSIDPNKSGESLTHNDDTKPHGKPEKYSFPLKSELSNEPHVKHIGRSSDHFDSLVPKYTLSSCTSPALSHINSISPVLSHKENTACINDVERVQPSSPAFRLSPMGLARRPYTPPVSPACPPVHPSSRSSTPDRCTRQLSPSPSYSFCSSPSPSQWGSTPDCADGDCKNRKTHRIKSTYKALAAIPTNTLLLEQQAIDEDVNKKEASLNPADNYSWEDPHEEMCSPAQLRQQTADLYATIDEVLEDSIQKHQSDVNRATLQSLAVETSRTSSPSPKLLGRETRYACSPFQPFVTTEKTLTKPGVIRPVTAASRVTDDKHDEEFHPNPFKNRQENKSSRYQYKFASGGEPEGGGASGDCKTRLTSLITQTRISTQDPPASINTQETHI